MNVALEELFTRLGFDRRKVWRLSVAFWTLFTASCVLAVYMSSWGQGSFITLGLYLYMMLVALPILFAPAFWLIAGGLFALIGQFGGKTGPSVDDAISAVKEYGTAILGKGAYVMLLALPIWFIAMRLIDTKGIEEWFLFVFPLLPTTIYLVVKRWPDGKTFEAVVRTTLLVVVLGILALGVFNTLERKVTDPANQVVLQYYQQQQGASKTNDLLVAQQIVAKLEKKQALTADEQKAWSVLTKEAQAKSLTVTAGKLATDVLDGKATDPSWWQEHWVAIAIAALGLGIAYKVFSTTPATATVGSATTSGHATKGRRWWPWVLLAFLAWSAYSIDQEVGFPGAWLEKKVFSESFNLMVRGFSDEEVCGLHFPPGRKLRFRPHANNSLGEFPATVQNGDRSFAVDLAATLRIEGTPYKRAFRPQKAECLRISWAVADEAKTLQLTEPVIMPVVIEAN